jgi:hypothetical protein
MTTLQQARDELAVALTTAGVPIGKAPGEIAPPSGVIFGDGIDLAHVGRGQIEARFRATLLSGKWDQAAAADGLRTLVLVALGAIRSLAGWRLVEVRRDTVIDIAGGSYLAADVIASRFVDIS